MIGIFNGIDHTVPKNAGSFRRLRILLRENCVVGIPRHPASCSVATTNIADRVVNAVQRALGELGDGFGMAEIGLSMPPSVAVISGHDPRADGAPFVNMLILPSLTGGAGTPHQDGWLTAGLPVGAGVMRRDSTEIDELRYPIVVWEQRILPDTEGAGRFRGAPGSYCVYGPLPNAEVDVAWGSDGSIHPALGACSGLAGGCADQYKRLVSGELERLELCGLVTLKRGEAVVSISCGGGGYGPPFERDPARVRRDVLEGWVSRERAEQVYGVLLTDEGLVEHEETRIRRAKLAP
jgi:N-methylhydantoinase B